MGTSGITGGSKLSVLFPQQNFHSEVVVPFLLRPAGLGIRDGAPQLKDEVVGEAECLKVGVVDGLGQLHCVGFTLRELPDLRRCEKYAVSKGGR